MNNSSSKLLFFGKIKSLLSDDAVNAVSCADKDVAFTLVADSADDVFGMDVEELAHEEAQRGDPVEAQVRLLFYCAEESDRTWLAAACTAQPDGVGTAWVEVDTMSAAATCVIRTLEGVREVAISPAG